MKLVNTIAGFVTVVVCKSVGGGGGGEGGLSALSLGVFSEY